MLLLHVAPKQKRLKSFKKNDNKSISKVNTESTQRPCYTCIYAHMLTIDSLHPIGDTRQSLEINSPKRRHCGSHQKPLAASLESVLTLPLHSARLGLTGNGDVFCFFFRSRKRDSCSSGQQTHFSEWTVNFWTCVSNRSGGFGEDPGMSVSSWCVMLVL